MKVPLSRRAQLHGTAIGLGRSVTPVFHQCTYRREKSLVRSDWQILCLCLRVSPCSYCEQPNWRISTNSTKPVPITDPHAWGLQRTSFPLPSTSGAWLSLCQSVGSVGVPFFTWAGHMSKPACRGTCSHPPHFYGGAGLRRLQQQERTVLLSKHPWKSWIFESRIIFEGIVFHFRSFWFQALMWLVVQARCIPGRPCRAPRARMGLVHHSECQLWSCWGSLPKSWLSWRATTTRVPLLEVLWLPRIIELWPLSYVIITLKTLWDKQRDQSASFFVGTPASYSRSKFSVLHAHPIGFGWKGETKSDTSCSVWKLYWRVARLCPKALCLKCHEWK